MEDTPERKKHVQQPRQRRACLGELVQIDGSDHAWFEERGARCTLLVYLDDATGRLQELRFAPETTFDYFESTQRYLTEFGKPVVFYSDPRRSALFALCDRGTDLPDCLALAPTREELAECLPWLELQDGNELWPQHVRATPDTLTLRLGHGV